MKKLFLLIAITLATGSFAQIEGSSNKTKTVVDPAMVPESAKGTFIKENPALEATWKVDGKNYKAEYVDDANVAHARIYDKAGNILWRDDEMSSYPPAITEYYSANYPGEGYMIWSRIDNAGVTTYYAYRNSEMIWFDRDGKALNPKKNKTANGNGNGSIKMK